MLSSNNFKSTIQNYVVKRLKQKKAINSPSLQKILENRKHCSKNSTKIFIQSEVNLKKSTEALLT